MHSDCSLHPLHRLVSHTIDFINSRSHTDSHGIVPSHPEDALRTLQILLPPVTLNNWIAVVAKELCLSLTTSGSVVLVCPYGEKSDKLLQPLILMSMKWITRYSRTSVR